MSVSSWLRLLAVVSSFTGVFATANAAEPGSVKLAILPIQSDLPKTKLEVLSDALAGATGDLLNAEVLGPSEVRELLPPQQQRAASTCDNVFCFTKIGKQLQVALILATKATAAKDKVLLSFKVVNVENQAVAARYQQAVNDDVLTYSNEVRAALGQLRTKLPATLQSSAPQPKAPEPVVKTEPAKPKPDEGAKGKEAAKPAAATPAAPTATVSAKPGWLGMSHRDLDAEAAANLGLKSPGGSIVQRITDNGPAAAAGIKVGNAVLKADGKVVSSAADLSAVLAKKKAGEPLELVLWSDGQESTVIVTLREAPSREKK